MAAIDAPTKLPGWAALPVLASRRAVVVAVLAYVAAWVALVFGPGVDPTLREVVMSWGRYPLLLLGVALAFVAATAVARDRRSAWSWRLLCAAFGVVALGDIVWGYLSVIRHQDATFSVSNLFYLSYFPLIIAGLLAMPRVFRSRRDATMFALDAFTVAVGAGMVLWYVALRPALGAASGGPWIRTAMALAYPIGDMLTVLGIALVLLRQPHGSARRVSAWLALSLLSSLAGDTLWIFGKVLGLANTLLGSHMLWLLQTVFFFAAAREQIRRSLRAGNGSGEQPVWRDTFRPLPICASVLGFVLLALVARSGDRAALDPALIAATVLLGLVAARHLLGQRENAQLLEENIRRRGESRFAALIEHASDAILIIDAAGRILYASPAAARLVAPDGAAPGHQLAEFLHDDDRDAFADYVAGCRAGHVKATRLVLRFRIGAEACATTETTLSNLLGDSKVAGIVLNVRDVTERHALEEQLRFQALHDPLSGLPNRELFLDRVARALLRCQQGRDVVGVAVLDLDRFKLVNDGLGHRVGDRVLAATASRLAAVLTGADSTARLGGDEFGLLFEDTGRGEPIMVRLERMRAALAHPLTIDGHSIRLTASAGLATSAGVKDADSLLRNADIALHEAKNAGGDRSELFRTERHGRAVERLALEAALPRLLESNAFTLQFQPILRVADGRPVGLSIQLDWRDRASAPAPIAEALAAAREAGLGDLTGRWMLQALQRDIPALVRYVPEAAALALHLRLDPGLLRDPALPGEVAKLLQRLDLAPRNLVFELHEPSFAADDGAAPPELTALRAVGVSLALAEFGTAHATFELLDALPFEVLVLAESLVERIETGERPGALVRAAIATGRALGMRVVAPGVRSARQAALLASLGCEQALGDHLAPSLPYERVLTWLGGRFAEAAENARR